MTEDWISLSGGTFSMGEDGPLSHPADGEGPVRLVELAPFAISATTVTNLQFARFVNDTDYCTDAEKHGWSFVFVRFLTSDQRRTSPRPPGTPWWCATDGACWSRPTGWGSSVDNRGDHPVVHVSWNDAQAFATWTGSRLPLEAEWEYAARGGLERATYPWGDELDPHGDYRCNIFRGRFPVHSEPADGYHGTAPVRTYAPNGFGLYQAVGNVWEWCADRWEDGRVMRGGSYLCHDSYCNRYRVSARTHNGSSEASGNLGFRCARDL